MSCQIGVVTETEGRDDIHSEGGEGGRRVRQWPQLQMRAWTTYTLEMERKGETQVMVATTKRGQE